jgi:S1-C subfamily serine protease
MKVLLAGLMFLISACSVVTNDFYESSVELTRHPLSTRFCTAGHVGDGYFVTAAHCTIGSSPILIEGEAGELVATSIPKDVSIVFVPQLEYKISSNSLRCVTPSIGTKIVMVGEPGGNDDIHTFGYVASSIRKEKLWEEAIAVNIVGAPGSSGSPIYNTRNEIVAMLTGGKVAYGGLAIAVPGSTICDVWKNNASE